uniref:Uncharacterized protein n=1 Tax=Lepeophtheirus salmonis TaxID=72036 RepID=A0A0K2TG61_LEPSM
MHRYKRDPFY